MCQCQNQACCSKKGCSCHQSFSGTGNCLCGCHSENRGAMESKKNRERHASQFFELADQAWMEVLKEKIKEHIRANSKHMDDLAKLISQANHERWKKKMDEENSCLSFEDQLKEFFMHSHK